LSHYGKIDNYSYSVYNVFYVPLCPTERHGEEVDLTTADFSWHIFDSAPDESGRLTTTELIAAFNTGDDHENLVESDTVKVPLDSDLSVRARQLGDGGEGIFSEGPRIEEMRQFFCERVANCHGVINGECWALGASAVQEVLSQVTDGNS
jgi:hypothetical protein